MCVLCGDPLLRIHWTEKQRSLDENILLSTFTSAVDQQHTRILERRHKTQLTNQILRYYGLKLEDWTHRKFILSDRKGSSTIINDMGDLWPAVEKMIHFTPDPLDPILLEKMKSVEIGGGA